MDPNANLAELRELASAQLNGGQTDPDRMAELVEALDEWITRGGFLPADWTQEA